MNKGDYFFIGFMVGGIFGTLIHAHLTGTLFQ